MNPQLTPMSTKKAIWLRWPFLLTVIPLTLLLLAATALGINEWRAAGRVESELARIQAAGHPIDDASMSRWFFDHTSQEGTAQWSNLLSLVTVGSSGFQLEQLPYLGNAPIPAEIVPAEPWDAEPAVAEFLQWMQPVIEELHAATEYPTPVWQPIEFRGFATLLESLQNSRSLARLLSLEVEHALYHGDSDRALRSLQTMQGVAAAFEWQSFMVADMVTSALHQSHHAMIQRSLAVAPWSEEQLQLLQDQVAIPREVASRWGNVIAGERAFLTATLSQISNSGESSFELGGIDWLWRIPSLQEGTLSAYREIEAVGAQGLTGLVERANLLTEDWRRPTGPERIFNSLNRMFLPAFESYAVVIEREEMSRRLTLTAIAIKRFQLGTGQWPERLDQLKQVGLEPADWHTVSAGAFGYEVGDNTAYLWSFAHGKESAVPANRPAPPDLNSSQPTTPTVVIR